MTAVIGPSLHLDRFLFDMLDRDGRTTKYSPPHFENASASVAVKRLLTKGSKNKPTYSSNDLLEYLSQIDAEEPKPAVVAPPDISSSSSPVATEDDALKPVEKSYEKVSFPPVESERNENTLRARPYGSKFEKTGNKQSIQEKLLSETKIHCDTIAATADDLKPSAELTAREENNIVSTRTSIQKVHPSASPAPSHSQTGVADVPADEHHPPHGTARQHEDHILHWTNATWKDILEHIHNDLDQRKVHGSTDASAAEDAASLNTRNEIWTISSFRTNKSILSGADAESILDIAVPPDVPDDEDWSLPLESLLKPIKKNTYGQIVQEQVQEFLAGSLWGAESSEEEKNETLWTAKRVPCRQVDQPVGADTVPLAGEAGDIPRGPMEPPSSRDAVDPFLESIVDREENGGRPNRWTRPARPRKLNDNWRGRQYPGSTVVYSKSEFYGERTAGNTRHRVYIKQLGTQSPTPDYYRRHRQNSNLPLGHARPLLPAKVEVPPDPQLLTHKVPSPCLSMISLMLE